MTEICPCILSSIIYDGDLSLYTTEATEMILRDQEEVIRRLQDLEQVNADRLKLQGDG